MCVLLVGEAMLGKVTAGDLGQKPALSPGRQLALAAAGSTPQTQSGLRDAGLRKANRRQVASARRPINKRALGSVGRRRDVLRAVPPGRGEGDRP